MLVDLRNIQQSCHRVNDNALLPQSRDDVNGTDERSASYGSTRAERWLRAFSAWINFREKSMHCALE